MLDRLAADPESFPTFFDGRGSLRTRRDDGLRDPLLPQLPRGRPARVSAVVTSIAGFHSVIPAGLPDAAREEEKCSSGSWSVEMTSTIAT